MVPPREGPRPLRYLSCQLLCTLIWAGKGAVLGAEQGRMSQKRVCSGCACIQPLAHPGCRHPPDPPCHPSPHPLGALHCLWKKILPIHQLPEEHKQIRVECYEYPQWEMPSDLFLPCVLSCPGSSSPFPSLTLSRLGSPVLSPPLLSQPCSPQLHGGLGPAGAVQEGAGDTQWKNRQVQ